MDPESSHARLTPSRLQIPPDKLPDARALCMDVRNALSRREILVQVLAEEASGGIAIVLNRRDSTWRRGHRLFTSDAAAAESDGRCVDF